MLLKILEKQIKNSKIRTVVHRGRLGMWAESLRYCNARPTLDGAGASSYSPSPFKNKFNIEEDT